MSHLSHFVRECLVETSGGRAADQLAKKVMRAIVSRLKSDEIFQLISKKKNAETVIDEEDVPGLGNFVDYVRFIVEFDPALDMQEVSSEATFIQSSFQKIVDVTLYFPARRPFRLVDLEDVYPEILHSVRHELEHARQKDLEGVQDEGKLDTPEKLKEYFLESSEVEAHVSGFMAKAKALRIPFVEVLDDFLDKLCSDAQDAGMDEENAESTIDEIRDTYIKYAKKRYRGLTT